MTPTSNNPITVSHDCSPRSSEVYAAIRRARDVAVERACYNFNAPYTGIDYNARFLKYYLNFLGSLPDRYRGVSGQAEFIGVGIGELIDSLDGPGCVHGPETPEYGDVVIWENGRAAIVFGFDSAEDALIVLSVPSETRSDALLTTVHAAGSWRHGLVSLVRPTSSAFYFQFGGDVPTRESLSSNYSRPFLISNYSRPAIQDDRRRQESRHG